MSTKEAENKPKTLNPGECRNPNVENVKYVFGSTDTMSEDGEINDVQVAIETEREVDEPKEGGWGWWIIMGTIFLRIVLGGIMRSNGLFFIQFQERFGGGAAETAWVTSLSATVRLLSGPAISILCNRFSARQLVFCGTVFYVISLIISAFAQSTTYLYFSYGAVGGIGRAFILTPLPILLGSYFNKRRSMAFGLSSSGFGIGGFTMTPLVEIMFQTYGFTGTFILLGGVACHLFVFAALFRPPEKATVKNKTRTDTEKEGDTTDPLLPAADTTATKTDVAAGDADVTDTPAAASKQPDEEARRNSTEKIQNGRLSRRRSTFQGKVEAFKSAFREDESSGKKPLIAFSVLKDIRFVTLCFATFCFSIPTMGLFIPPMAKSHGLTTMECAYLLSITAGSDTVSRIIAGFILDIKALRTLRPIIYNALTFAQIIPCFLFPFLRTFNSFACVCSLHGCVMGVKASQRNVVLVDILGVDKLASSFAILLAVQGIGTLLGPPISGFLRDVSGSYEGTFFFAGSAISVGACILVYGNVRNHFRIKNKKKLAGEETKDEKGREINGKATRAPNTPS